MESRQDRWNNKMDMIGCLTVTAKSTGINLNKKVQEINNENNNNNSIMNDVSNVGTFKSERHKSMIARIKQFKDKTTESGNQCEEIDSDFSSLSCDDQITDIDGKYESSILEEEISLNSLMYRGCETKGQPQKTNQDLIVSPKTEVDSPGDRKLSAIKSLSQSKLPVKKQNHYKRIRSLNRDEHDDIVCSCGSTCGSNSESKEKKDSISSPESSPTRFGSPRRSLKLTHKLISLSDSNNRRICNKHMPWFGIDVGGSLVKVVFFDPADASKEEITTLSRIRRYLKSSKAFGTTGKRDAHLEMPSCVINKHKGTLHFIRFATNQMPQFLHMAKSKGLANTISTVCATGGGAYKFEEDIKKNLGISLHKTDELDSIIHGIHYIDKYNSLRECYFLEDPLDDAKCIKVPYDFSRPYPYLVVNIGSGVSILAVYSSTSYSRISGSSIGGGTFLGLCSLLTQCKTFDEAICLAKAGSSAKIDKLVKDIYGGDYPKFNLTGDTVASSFGHMNIEKKRKDVKREDLARALLEMVTINIGSIARMCAANEDIDRVVFIGNFLRVNQLSMKLLSYAVNYWSKGAMKALFLEHEGYFGAVGCFVESIEGCPS